MDDEAYSTELRTSVHQAATRGVAWLQTRQSPSGSWGATDFGMKFPAGATALAVLALLKPGVTREDPAVQRGLRFLGATLSDATYEAGVPLMALAAFVTERATIDRILGHRDEAGLVSPFEPRGPPYAG